MYSINLYLSILFILTLIIMLARKRKEYFQTGYPFQRQRDSILRCTTFDCLKTTEANCLKFCGKLRGQEYDTCHWACKKHGDDTVDDFIWNDAIFNSAKDHFIHGINIYDDNSEDR